MDIKEKILAYLENNRGEYTSGQEIAQALSVSRVYVWKMIRALEAEGYEIQGVKNRGYQLGERSDILSPQGISAYLDGAIRDIQVFDTLDSTNTYAKELAAKGASHGTAILAKEQTAGKGRQGRQFYSPRDTGLYMSVILRPKQQLEQATITTITAAVAVCQALENLLNIKPRIKWVNDIFIGTKKVCGILAEGVFQVESGMVDSIIVGMGINIDTVAFPGEIAQIAGSVGPCSKNQLAAQILLQLEQLADCPDVISRYKSRSMVLGKHVTYTKDGVKFEGKVLDISATGSLILEDNRGNRSQLQSGEISLDKDFLYR